HNPEILALLRDNGCVSITMGVQSGSDHILRDVFNRPTRLKRVIEAGQEIVDAGIPGSFDLIPVTGFETEQDLRDTFTFLLDFPRELKLQVVNEMIYLPTYGITRSREQGTLASTRLPQALYDYYIRLFFLTRENLPRADMLRIADDPECRRNPVLLDNWLHGKTLLDRLIGQHGNTGKAGV